MIGLIISTAIVALFVLAHQVSKITYLSFLKNKGKKEHEIYYGGWWLNLYKYEFDSGTTISVFGSRLFFWFMRFGFQKVLLEIIPINESIAGYYTSITICNIQMKWYWWRF